MTCRLPRDFVWLMVRSWSCLAQAQGAAWAMVCVAGPTAPGTQQGWDDLEARLHFSAALVAVALFDSCQTWPCFHYWGQDPHGQDIQLGNWLPLSFSLILCCLFPPLLSLAFLFLIVTIEPGWAFNPGWFILNHIYLRFCTSELLIILEKSLKNSASPPPSYLLFISWAS